MSPDRRIRRLALGMIAAPPPPILPRLARAMSRLLPVPCRLIPSPLPVDTVVLPGRDQIDADRLLHALEAQEIEPGEALCGVTDRDIGHLLFTHFFGRARRGGDAMVVSLARLAPEHYGLPRDDDVLVHRAALEILHELGHVTGLPHCDDFGCIMHFAADVERLDARGEWFCVDCVEPFLACLPAADRPV